MQGILLSRQHSARQREGRRSSGKPTAPATRPSASMLISAGRIVPMRSASPVYRESVSTLCGVEIVALDRADNAQTRDSASTIQAATTHFSEYRAPASPTSANVPNQGPLRGLRSGSPLALSELGSQELIWSWERRRSSASCADFRLGWAGGTAGTLAWLLRFVTLLDRDVEIIIRPKAEGHTTGGVSVSIA
jgi:hypothetical protein